MLEKPDETHERPISKGVHCIETGDFQVCSGKVRFADTPTFEFFSADGRVLLLRKAWGESFLRTAPDDYLCGLGKGRRIADMVEM